MQVESLARELAAPQTGGRLLTWFGCVSYSGLVGALLLLRPPCPDLATFDYAGWVVSSGGTPYVDVVEQNWPGAILLHALAAAVFGNHLWSFRVLDFALLLLGTYGLFQLASLGGRPATRWIVAALYPALYVSANDWLVGQRDMAATHLMLVLALAYARRLNGGPPLLSVLTGAGMALVVLTRPTHLVYLPLLFAADRWLAVRTGRTWRQSASDVVLAGATLTVILSVLALCAWPSSALSGWYQATILFNARLYSHTAGPLEMIIAVRDLAYGYGWVCAVAVLGLGAWWRRGERNVLAVVVCLALTGVISFVVQGKGFGYHLASLCPGVALFAAECVACAMDVRRQQRGRIVPALAALLCVLVFAGTVKKVTRMLQPQLAYVAGLIDEDVMASQVGIGIGVTVMDVQQVVQYVRDHTRPDERVLVWGRAVLINYLAERRLPTPLATVGVLDHIGDPSAPLHSLFVDFERTLQESPPALLITYNARMASEHRDLWEAGASAPASVRVRSLLTTRYRLAERFGPLDVFVLAEAPGAGPAAFRTSL